MNTESFITADSLSSETWIYKESFIFRDISTYVSEEHVFVTFGVEE
jgi:hypothetical protein